MSRHRLARTAVVVGLLAVVFAACGGSGADGGNTLVVTGTDGLQFEPEQLSVSPGQVTVELTAGDEVEHTFVIEELGDQPMLDERRDVLAGCWALSRTLRNSRIARA